MRTNGINHLALVCRDMAETVAFYTQILDMPLVKTVALPDGGQHFFFDCGGGNLLAFFWWENGPPAAPGIASVEDFPAKPMSAVGSMNPVAFTVDEDELEALFEVDPAVWAEEAALIPAFYERFGDRLPEALWREHKALLQRLDHSRSERFAAATAAE